MKKSAVCLSTSPRYGIDSPGVVGSLAAAGAASLAAGVFVGPFRLGYVEMTLVGPTLMALGCLSLLLAFSLLLYSVVGKLRVRDAMLDMVKWRGDEAVLDVGTGLGLLAIGAAKRLRGGTVTGIDIWSERALLGNGFDRALLNIECEAVQGRVQLLTEDACDIGFVDNSFDVVLSLLCLHNVGEADARRKACLEIARVLKPR
jgi:SAM-dependent methyltransferase